MIQPLLFLLCIVKNVFPGLFSLFLHTANFLLVCLLVKTGQAYVCFLSCRIFVQCLYFVFYCKCLYMIICSYTTITAVKFADKLQFSCVGFICLLILQEI